MAVAEVVVLPLHRMVHETGRQRHIGGERFERFEQGAIEMPTMHAPLDSLEIAPELRGPLDRAHRVNLRGPQSSRLSSASASAGLPSSTTSPRRAAWMASTAMALGTNAPKSGP